MRSGGARGTNAHAFAGAAQSDRRLLARRQLPHGRPDLPAGERAPPRAAAARTHQATPARPLGDVAGAEPDVRAPEPGHPAGRARRALSRGARARRARPRGQRLSRGHLFGDLPARFAKRRGDAQPLPAVLDARRHPEPRRRAHPGVHPRRRRARLRARPRLRRGLRQPRPRGRGGGGGWRSGDRPARGLVEGGQVPEPDPRWRGAAHLAPQWLQDLGPDGARARQRRRHPQAPRGARLRGALRGRERARAGAPGARRDPRRVFFAHPRNSSRRPQARVHPATAVACHRASHAKGLDGAEARRRRRRGGHVPLAPGPDHRRAQEPRAPGDPRAMDAELSARSALRLPRRARAEPRGAGPQGRPAHEREPARQRRPAHGGSRSPRLPRVRRPRGEAGHGRSRVDPPARAAHARPLQEAREELPALLSRRDQFEPPGRRVPGREALLGGDGHAHRRPRLARGARDGGAERAPLSGLARGLRAHGAPRPLRDLRSVRDGRGLHGHPAREVARRVDQAALARAGALR